MNRKPFPPHGPTLIPEPNHPNILRGTTEYESEVVWYHITAYEDLGGPFYSLSRALDALHTHLEELR